MGAKGGEEAPTSPPKESSYSGTIADSCSSRILVIAKLLVAHARQPPGSAEDAMQALMNGVTKAERFRPLRLVMERNCVPLAEFLLAERAMVWNRTAISPVLHVAARHAGLDMLKLLCGTARRPRCELE